MPTAVSLYDFVLGVTSAYDSSDRKTSLKEALYQAFLQFLSMGLACIPGVNPAVGAASSAFLEVEGGLVEAKNEFKEGREEPGEDECQSVSDAGEETPRSEETRAPVGGAAVDPECTQSM